MEEMGMTDNQWKDNLRMQLEDWEEVFCFFPFFIANANYTLTIKGVSE